MCFCVNIFNALFNNNNFMSAMISITSHWRTPQMVSIRETIVHPHLIYRKTGNFDEFGESG